MTIRFTCESCDSTLNIKDEKAGQAGKCPKCGESFTVPSPSAKKKSSAKKKKADQEKNKVEERKKQAEREAFFDEYIAQDEAKPSYDEAEEMGFERPKTGRALSKTSGSAAGTAGDLLSLTGKKGRADSDEEWDDAQSTSDEVGLTVGNIAEGVGRQLALPIAGVGAAIALVIVLAQMIFAPNRELPNLAHVSGKVTLDDKPLAQATVKFILKEAYGYDAKVKASAAFARTNDEGEFTIKYASDVEGAVVGVNRVEINARAANGVEILPRWYNFESELEFEVEPESNTEANFPLSTKTRGKKPSQPRDAIQP